MRLDSRKWILLAVISVSSQTTMANTPIQFPEAELARESVYPKFDNPQPVMRRNVVTAKHFELQLFGGWNLNDAFFDPMTGGVSVAYNFNEFHAIQISGQFYSTKPSQYVAPLEDAAGGVIKNLKNAPAPKSMILGSYQLTPYYGKISVTKQTVWNIAIFMTAGAGTMAIGDGQSTVLSIGLGQKIYFGKKWGLRTDLRALFYQAPNPVSITIPDGTTPKNSEYKSQNVTNGQLTLGLVYLL